MASFPAIRNGSRIAMYGTTQSIGPKTTVVQFENGSEQRWNAVRSLWSGMINFTSVSGYDLGLVQQFFRSMKGQLDKTWDITIGGALYNNLTFEQDDFPQTEVKNGRFSFSLKCRQVRKN